MGQEGRLGSGCQNPALPRPTWSQEPHQPPGKACVLTWAWGPDPDPALAPEDGASFKELPP